MRLIDADKLIEDMRNLAKRQISNCPNIAEFFVSIRVDRIIDILNSQPTAFDVDKVVEQLDEKSQLARPVGWVSPYEIILTKDVMKIVKAGGTDDN